MFRQIQFVIRLGSRVALVVMAVLSSAGCESGSDRLARRTIAISDVPSDVMDAANKALPDVEFADGWKNVDKDGNLQSYEIRGRNKKGKIREVRVSPAGKILEME